MPIRSFPQLKFDEIVIEELNTVPSALFVNDGGSISKRKIMSFSEINLQIERQKDTSPNSPVLIPTTVLESTRDLIKKHPAYKAVQAGLLKRVSKTPTSASPTRQTGAAKNSPRKPQA